MPARTTWDTPSADTAPPEVGPRYVVRGELGRGGMGRVLLAWDRLLDREVAIKEVSVAASPAVVARFLAEARLTARLEHPSIIPVHDAGEGENGALFYVMKRVEGQSLAEALDGCASLPERLAHLDRLIDVVHAVAHAHARGVLHRDLKPANIMLGPRGETLLLDWGIALHLTDPRAGIAGTPGFMSPEQCREEPLDVRSDVWALGAILHQVLTGHPPAEGDDPWGVIRRVATDPIPPVRLVAPEAPPPLAAIADRALAFRREDRYPTADAMVADLQAWRTGLAVSAYHYRPGEAVVLLARRYRLPLAALAIGLVLALFSAVTGFLRVRAERDVAERALAMALEQQAAVADRDGDGLGALVYAAAALSRGERPLARGFVVRHRGTFPYRLAERVPLGGCLLLTEHACVRAGEVAERGGRWRIPLAAPIVAAQEAPGRLLLASAREVRSVDVLTGEVVATYPATAATDVWPDPADPERFAWSEGRHLVRIEHGVRSEREYASLIKAVGWAGPLVCLATASGEVWTDADSPGMSCQERRGLASAEFSGSGDRLLAVTFNGTLEVLDPATCTAKLTGASDVPVGGRMRSAADGAAFFGRVSDGTVRAWDALGDEVLRLPRTAGWDAAVRPAGTGFEVTTPGAVLRYEAAPARLGAVPGPRTVTAIAAAAEETWIVGADGNVSRWGWDRRLRWARPSGPVRALAWADDQAWSLTDSVVLPFTKEGRSLPPIDAPLVRGMLADRERREVLLSGMHEQAALTRAGQVHVGGPGTDGRLTRGASGWLVPGGSGGWVRLHPDGSSEPLDAPPDVAWCTESADGRHHAWIDAAGAPWIDGVQVAPPTERRQWIEWLTPDRWFVASRIDSSVLDDHGKELLRREFEHGRVSDIAPAGDRVLVFGSDQRAEAWDLSEIRVSPEEILSDAAARFGVRLDGSALRLDEG